jgi:hypothetical protein
MRPRRALALLLPVLGSLLLLSFLGPSSLSADKPSPAELKDKVKGLVEQLADKDPDKQDAAALELIQLGPDVLPFLPKPNAKLSEAQKKALAVVRKSLRDQQIKRDLDPKLVTINDEQPVSKMLAELEKQTGIRVDDRREGTDSKIKLKLNKVTFWQALDAIAKEADGVVGYYRGETISLEARPPNYQSPTVSYDGIFRTTIRRITSILDLDSDVSVYRATVEVAWEPRFRPFRLDFAPSEVTVQDDKGTKIDVGEAEKEPLAVANPFFVRFDVPLGSVQRETRKLGLLKGNLKFVGPTRMDSFAFEKTLAEMQKDPKARELTQEGVTVKVAHMDLEKSHWTLVMALEYPADGPQFESFESWLIFNKLSLKSKEGDNNFPSNGGYVIQGTAGNRATVEYHFVDSKKDKLTRGDPGDWKPVYKVPGLIVEVPASFEFKDVRLP